MAIRMEEIHGGDIYRNHVRLDFSVNVNPLGIPKAVKNALHQAVEDCDKYPDIKGEKLKEQVSNLLKVPKEYLVFGNGASELLMASVHGIRPGKIVIPVPSFYGYEHAARALDGEIVYYEMKEENGFLPDEDLFQFPDKEAGLLFLANPNNPTGSIMSRDYVRRVVSHCRDNGTYVILDECFIEFCIGNHSMLREIEQFRNLILVRAFTKIFAIPGVRLGYLVSCNEALLAKIKRQLPEWNLSGFAQAAGCACALEKDFLDQTARYVREERQFLKEGLNRLGIRVVSGKANFLLVQSNVDLYKKLLDKGILIRDCRNFKGLPKGFYRIAVRSRKENEALLEAVRFLRNRT